jgi:Domain of Unknown Function (DUF1543)
MDLPKLYMLLLGASVPGRYTEQHDIFFSIGKDLDSLVPAIRHYWPEANQKLHVDAWREIKQVDGFDVRVVEKAKDNIELPASRLFFLNLGGYKKDEFDEFHYKIIVAAVSKGEAVQKAKETAFYKHMNFTKEAGSHIDDKYGVDVDDFFEIADILPREIKEQYTIRLTPAVSVNPDTIHLGYFKLDKLKGIG